MLTVGCTLFYSFPFCAHSKTVCSGANLVTGEYRKINQKETQINPSFYFFTSSLFLNLLAIATLLSN